MSDESIRAYLAETESRLTADGCVTAWEERAAGPVLVGRRDDFRVRWMFTRLHLFTVAASVAEVTVPVIERFTENAMHYAKREGGPAVGWQVGVGVFPVLVSDRVDPAAAAWAEAKQRSQYACMARPVVVDSAQRRVSTFRGTSIFGAIYASHLKDKSARYFHAPGGLVGA